MLNVSIIMGRLAADPELKHTSNDVSVTSFTIAVDRDYQKSGEDRKTDWIDVVAWRNTAEFICRYFKKGQMIIIEGSLQTRIYEDKNGGKRKAVEVIASNVNFGQAKAKEDAAVPAPSYSPETEEDKNKYPLPGSKEWKEQKQMEFSPADNENWKEYAYTSDEDLPF